MFTSHMNVCQHFGLEYHLISEILSRMSDGFGVTSSGVKLYCMQTHITSYSNVSARQIIFFNVFIIF